MSIARSQSRPGNTYGHAPRAAAPGALPRRNAHRGGARAGFSLLEFEVALLLLGVALTGLFPLAAVYSRGLESLERRSPSAGQWYLVPLSDVWARKLGAAASLTNNDPGPKPAPPVLIVDMSETTYVGSSFIELLVRAWKRLKHRNGMMALCALQPFCREIMKISRLDSIWPIYADRVEAKNALAAS